jgi:hypothetical protein
MEELHTNFLMFPRSPEIIIPLTQAILCTYLSTNAPTQSKHFPDFTLAAQLLNVRLNQKTKQTQAEID